MKNTVFTNHCSQAERQPADAQRPEAVKRIQVRARRVDRIISPVGCTWDGFFLNGRKASEDFWVKRESQEQPERDAL